MTDLEDFDDVRSANKLILERASEEEKKNEKFFAEEIKIDLKRKPASLNIFNGKEEYPSICNDQNM